MASSASSPSKKYPYDGRGTSIDDAYELENEKRRAMSSVKTPLEWTLGRILVSQGHVLPFRRPQPYVVYY